MQQPCALFGSRVLMILTRSSLVKEIFERKLFVNLKKPVVSKLSVKKVKEKQVLLSKQIIKSLSFLLKTCNINFAVIN